MVLTLLATVEDWSRVADHVHWETMVVAVRPMDTLPPASKAVSRLSASWYTYLRTCNKIFYVNPVMKYFSVKYVFRE